MDFSNMAGKAHALIQLERYQEATVLARKAVQQGPTHMVSWRALVTALALAGNIEEARAMMRHHQSLETLSRWIGRTKITEKTRLMLIEGLRKAGMPE
jgi:Flp pilus assembly protein TadD